MEHQNAGLVCRWRVAGKRRKWVLDVGAVMGIWSRTKGLLNKNIKIRRNRKYGKMWAMCTMRDWSKRCPSSFLILLLYTQWSSCCTPATQNLRINDDQSGHSFVREVFIDEREKVALWRLKPKQSSHYLTKGRKSRVFKMCLFVQDKLQSVTMNALFLSGKLTQHMITRPHEPRA